MIMCKFTTTLRKANETSLHFEKMALTSTAERYVIYVSNI